MSSPYSNLNKSRKASLPAFNSGHRSVPFRQTMDIMDIVRSPKTSISDDIDEDRLLGEVTSHIAASKMRPRDPYASALPRLSESKPGSRMSGPINPSALPPPNDMDLMSTMMSRISQLELRVQFQAKEVGEKEKKINILEDKIKILNKSRAEGDQAKIEELEKQNQKLQNEMQEMEGFLADYGMIWVGDDSSESDHDETRADAGQDTHRTWSQSSSVPGEFKMDYNLVIENIKELNILAGDGIGQVTHTTDGARLKMPDPVNFTLYANGILLFNGPFRPFSDPETQHCLRDIMDGYFPSELQARYPDGVPFLVTDKRTVVFRDKRSDVFKGAAQTLGGDTKPSRLLPSNLEPSPKPADVSSRLGQEETSELPGPKLTVDQFLKKLPSSVIREGKVIDIRGSLSDKLKGDMSKRNNTVMLVETEAVKDMKLRLEEDESSRPPSSRNIATLRIKAEDQTYILKMKYHETVGHIRQYLDKKRKSGALSYQLVSSFPKKVFDDDSVTLEAAGLIPNATLHLLKPKK
ncbi:UBX domain-containing protein 11-like [Lineus longissimus]|uniref:UBX domain-containing protein 11-like n=1 Tax=Lineus longissimus TaxID=88925 RepID=UPI00315DFD1A